MSTLDIKALDNSTSSSAVINDGHWPDRAGMMTGNDKLGVPKPTEKRPGGAGLFDSDDSLYTPERTAINFQWGALAQAGGTTIILFLLLLGCSWPDRIFVMRILTIFMCGFVLWATLRTEE